MHINNTFTLSLTSPLAHFPSDHSGSLQEAHTQIDAHFVKWILFKWTV